MHVDIEKLKQIIESLYDEVGGPCLNSEVCIYEGEDANGEPMQLLLKATIDEDELTDSAGEYVCVHKYKPDA